MNDEKAIEQLEEFLVIDDWSAVYMPELQDAIEYVINRIKALKSGKWIQLSDNVNHFSCSVCGDADYYEDWTPKFCPECGAQMIGTVANKCGSCIHEGEHSVTGNCIRCRAFDRYESKENDNAK